MEAPIILLALIIIKYWTVKNILLFLFLEQDLLTKKKNTALALSFSSILKRSYYAKFQVRTFIKVLVE